MISPPTLVESWTVRKPAVHGTRGLVASQHRLASSIGAQVLEQGGNAVDAAVSAAFAIGVVEPWMSGLGGGGHMLVFDASSSRCHAVDFGMRAPLALNPDDYALVAGTDSDLFGWPSVREQRNVHGPHSVAVPGLVAGLATALERFGTRSLADALAPAIGAAREGIAVDWLSTLMIAAAAPVLARFGESARVYLPDGFPPAGEWGGPPPRIRLGQLDHTLQRLAEAGWQDFYHGELARALVADARAAGSALSARDLSEYRVRVTEADATAYRGATVHSAPGLTAGPTLRDVLARLDRSLRPAPRPGADAFAAYADAMLAAYERRLSSLGDADESSAPSCTTHLSVVDEQGNAVALTQTLLSVFGSKVVLPSTGILMNNGIMWFDPRPGRPNSIGPGKRPLSNMCPVVVQRADGLRFAAGASGGRRIMSAVLQLLSFLVDFELSVDEAVHHPRIDVSGSPWVLACEGIGDEVMARLAERHPVHCEPNAVYPALFACPNLVARAADGACSGGAFVMSPRSAVIGPRPR